MTDAVILAGGLGTRLRSAVPDVPKPMAPIAGRPFLEFLLDYWAAQGVSRFILSVGYRSEIIINHIGSNYKNIPVDYVIESTPLGTGGGLLLAVEKLRNAFLLLNGDTYFKVGLPALNDFRLAHDADWCFSLFHATEADRFMGMEVSSQGQIMTLKSGLGKVGQLANGGVYMVHPRVFAHLPYRAGQKVSLEEDILPFAMRAGQRLFGMACAGSFIDIGVPDDYRRASTVFI
jgi:D-glycero-alpha-D-manno-heptose 1-phosphate guanylyltransferase